MSVTHAAFHFSVFFPLPVRRLTQDSVSANCEVVMSTVSEWSTKQSHFTSVAEFQNDPPVIELMSATHANIRSSCAPSTGCAVTSFRRGIAAA